VVEYHSHTAEIAGSIPVLDTKIFIIQRKTIHMISPRRPASFRYFGSSIKKYNTSQVWTSVALVLVLIGFFTFILTH